MRITRGFTEQAQGSVLFESGRTRVLCTACVESGTRPFLSGTGEGWITAEYGMLPGSTRSRKPRPKAGQIDGRSQEIQRLIGRSLRIIADRKQLGEYTIHIDCDVLQADGGTRTASINGAMVALVDAIQWMRREGLVHTPVLTDCVAAISVGIVDGVPTLDLDYAQDSGADVDMNVVACGCGPFVEIQGTAEGKPFDDGQLASLLSLARKGIAEIVACQATALGGAWPFDPPADGNT